MRARRRCCSAMRTLSRSSRPRSCVCIESRNGSEGACAPTFVCAQCLALPRARSLSALHMHTCTCRYASRSPGGSGLEAAGDPARRAVQDCEREPRAVTGGRAGRFCAAPAARGCALARRWQAALSLSVANRLCVGTHTDMPKRQSVHRERRDRREAERGTHGDIMQADRRGWPPFD